jgi:hypothetical protein
MLQVNESRKVIQGETPENEEFWASLRQLRKHPMFRSTLLSYFLTMDLEDYNPNAPPPITELTEDMIEASRGYAESFILERPWWTARDDMTKSYVRKEELFTKFGLWVGYKLHSCIRMKSN